MPPDKRSQDESSAQGQLHKQFPPEQQLSFKVIQDNLEPELKAFINLVERSFPAGEPQEAEIVIRLLLKVSKNIYDTIIHLCQEKLRDPFQKAEFSLSSRPLIRVLLDILANLLFLSENLKERVSWYRKSGWREQMEWLKRFDRYRGDPNWDAWLAEMEQFLDNEKASANISQQEEADPKKKIKYWPYLAQMKKMATSADIRTMIEYIETTFYREFSQESHLTWPGLKSTGAALLIDNPEDQWQFLKQRSDSVMFAVTMILAILSEVEALLNFGRTEKLKTVWRVMSETFYLVKEFYEERYEDLLADDE